MAEQLTVEAREQLTPEAGKVLDQISGLKGKEPPAGIAAGLWVGGCHYERNADGTWTVVRCYA